MKVPILLRLVLLVFGILHVWTIPIIIYPGFLGIAFANATTMSNINTSLFTFPESTVSYNFFVRIYCGMWLGISALNIFSSILRRLHVDAFRTLVNLNLLVTFGCFVTGVWGMIELTIEYGYNNPNGTPIIVVLFLFKYAIFNIIFWVFRIRLSFRRKKEQKFEDVKFPDEHLEDADISSRKKAEIVKSYKLETAFVDDEDML